MWLASSYQETKKCNQSLFKFKKTNKQKTNKKNPPIKNLKTRLDQIKHISNGQTSAGLDWKSVWECQYRAAPIQTF